MLILSRLFPAARLVAIAFWALGCASLHAESRVALVIGNSAYRDVPMLPNTTKDATDTAAAFGKLGFYVATLNDASFDDLRRALITFAAKARTSEMAVVYFAGHGMEVAGENWIVPVDAALRADTDLETETVGLKSLMLAVSGAQTLGLVILDACRNNPFDARMQRSNRSRAVSRGLAPIEPANNVLVAYAAKDGTTAADGEGRNSPFTAALLKHIDTPGLEINFLFRNVRDDVLAATQSVQQPFFYGSLSKQAVYLRPPLVESASADQPDPPPAADEIAWPFVTATSDAALLRRFVGQFPASAHRVEAARRLATLETVPADAAPPASATTPAIATPEQSAVARPFKEDAAQVEAAWALVRTSADPGLIRRFSDEFPNNQRHTVVAALNGTPGSNGALRQLRSDQMHAVLSDYGQFVRHPRYGEVWVPTVTPKGWHPYEPCHWVQSKRFEWFYLDRTPWGAIVHHFGRWTHDDHLGWIWVPGVDFSPAWVVWRVGAGKVGWAPMPPDNDVRTISTEQFDNADFWIFMDGSTFSRGCSVGAISPVTSAQKLLQTTSYVRDLRTVDGVVVFVLPADLLGDPIDIDVVFDPWPPWLAGQIIVNWNAVWNATSPADAALCLPVVAPLPVAAPIKPPSAAPHLQPPPKKQQLQAPVKAVSPELRRPSTPSTPRHQPRRTPVDEPDEPIYDEPIVREPQRIPMIPRFYPRGNFGFPGKFGIPSGGGYPDRGQRY